jgi:hypothetical protein
MHEIHAPDFIEVLGDVALGSCHGGTAPMGKFRP